MEFNTHPSRSKHLPPSPLIYSHGRSLWSPGLVSSRLASVTVGHTSMHHIIVPHIRLWTLVTRRATSSLFGYLHGRIPMISSERKYWTRNAIRRARKGNGATWPSHLFILITMNENREARWSIVDTDDRSQMLIKRVTLWLLPFDYAHTALSHITPKYRAVCVRSLLNWLCIFFVLCISIFFSHVMDTHKSTWLWPVVHINRFYLPGYYRSFTVVSALFFWQKE